VSDAPVRIPDHEFAERRVRAGRAASQAGLDGLLVAGRSAGTVDSMRTVHWLTRHAMPGVVTTPTGPWRALGHDIVVLDGDGRGALATAGVGEAPVIDDVRIDADVEETVVGIIRDLGLERGRLGLAGSEVLPWALGRRLESEFPELVLQPADLLVARLRLHLSEAECQLLRQASAIGVEVLRAGLSAAVPGATDGDVAAAGLAVAARSPRTRHWDFMISSGPDALRYSSTAVPSWNPTRRYASGDLVHPDCYGFVDGYAYDLQRTVVVGGRPTARQRRLIEGSYEHAHRLGAEYRGGRTIRELFDTGVRIMGELGYQPRSAADSAWNLFPHVGHAFASGFDWPWLSPTVPDLDFALPTPCALTVELAWEEDGVGAAWIEECFLILDHGVECLTDGLGMSPGLND
jgi:Xaa-Pro aminopeptidase